MPKFPRTEAGIIALCQLMIAGLPSSEFTSSSIAAHDLQTQLDVFITKRSESAISEAAARQDIVEKNDALETLVDMMKTLLRDAENIAKDDDAKLGQIGWGAKASATALQMPEQPRNLEAVQQGDSWVFLDWKEPVGGGDVAFYRIERRERPDGEWEEAGSAIPSEYTLINQPKGVELEYRVVAVNKAGESTPSNSVMVVL